MKKITILILTLLVLLSVAACGKGRTDETTTDPAMNTGTNVAAPSKDLDSVLNDSDVPLELGAEVWDMTEVQ